MGDHPPLDRRRADPYRRHSSAVRKTGFPGLSNRNSPFSLAISTLAIAALFNPLRLRILAFIDRRFYRTSCDAEKSLSDFAVAIRSEVDLEQLGAAMLGIIHQTIRPERASLWLKPDRTSKGKITR